MSDAVYGAPQVPNSMKSGLICLIRCEVKDHRPTCFMTVPGHWVPLVASLTLAQPLPGFRPFS